MGEFDLQRTFLGAGTLAENLQDQAGTVDDLAVPGAFKVALLHRGQGRIDDDEVDFLFLQRPADHLDLAFAHQRRGAALAQRMHGGMDDRDADRGGEADRLGQAGFGRALAARVANGDAVRFLERQDDGGAGGLAAGLVTL